MLRGPPPATGPPPPMMIGSGNGGDTLSSYHSRVPFFYRTKEKKEKLFMSPSPKNNGEADTREHKEVVLFYY